MACLLMYRGDVVPKDVNVAVANVKAQRTRLEAQNTWAVGENQYFLASFEYHVHDLSGTQTRLRQAVNVYSAFTFTFTRSFTFTTYPRIFALKLQ